MNDPRKLSQLRYHSEGWEWRDLFWPCVIFVVAYSFAILALTLYQAVTDPYVKIF